MEDRYTPGGGRPKTGRRANVRWALIVGLAVLGLLRPLLSVAGLNQVLGTPATPVVATALIAAVWVGAVVVWRVPNPLATLLAAGTLYGVLAVALQQIIWHLVLDGPPEEAPSSAPVLVASWAAIVTTNAIWGAFLGLVARLISRPSPRRGDGR